MSELLCATTTNVETIVTYLIEHRGGGYSLGCSAADQLEDYYLYVCLDHGGALTVSLREKNQDGKLLASQSLPGPFVGVTTLSHGEFTSSTECKKIVPPEEMPIMNSRDGM